MTRTYTPRRAGKKWLEGAPEYILDVMDNGGKSADRYMVFFTGKDFLVPDTFANTAIQYLDLSAYPSHPQGISIWGDMTAYMTVCYRRRFRRHRIK